MASISTKSSTEGMAALANGSRAQVPRLVALTAEARAALGDRDEIQLTTFPFRVGRESRREPPSSWRSELERRFRRAPRSNDAYLLEAFSGAFYISREHFAIERRDGQFVLVDRESAGGTLVADRRVGGDRQGGVTTLHGGEVVSVGGVGSPYIFRFEVP